MALKISEKTIERQIITWLRAQGIFCTKIENQGTADFKKGIYRKQWGNFRRNGISDIYAQIKGHPIWIEVKSKTGRLSDHQKIWLDDVINNGGYAIVARSLDDVVDAIGHLI